MAVADFVFHPNTSENLTTICELQNLNTWRRMTAESWIRQNLKLGIWGLFLNTSWKSFNSPNGDKIVAVNGRLYGDKR